MAYFGPENFLGCGFGLFQLASAIWVFFDARSFDRELPNERVQPLLWLLGCFCIWIVVFPIYLLVSRPGYQRALDEVHAKRDRLRRAPQTSWPDRCPTCGRPMGNDSRVCPHCNTVRNRDDTDLDDFDHLHSDWDTAPRQARADEWEGRAGVYRCVACEKPMNPRAHRCPHCNTIQAPLPSTAETAPPPDAPPDHTSPANRDPFHIPPPDPDAPPPPNS